MLSTASMAAFIWSKPLTILRLPFLPCLVTSPLGGSRLQPAPSFLPLPFSNLAGNAGVPPLLVNGRGYL